MALHLMIIARLICVVHLPGALVCRPTGAEVFAEDGSAVTPEHLAGDDGHDVRHRELCV